MTPPGRRPKSAIQNFPLQFLPSQLLKFTSSRLLFFPTSHFRLFPLQFLPSQLLFFPLPHSDFRIQIIPTSHFQPFPLHFLPSQLLTFSSSQLLFFQLPHTDFRIQVMPSPTHYLPAEPCPWFLIARGVSQYVPAQTNESNPGSPGRHYRKGCRP
jgi:hypothetical protein